MIEEDILGSFGRTVQTLRLSKGWSQEKLAELSGLDRTYVSSVERGKRNVSILNICKLSNALDIPPSFLLNELEGM